jgi:cation diffusion facilitator family transporter
MEHFSSPEASRRKRAVALSSVVVSALLALSKIIIGFLTGSLAVLAQAADNFLDLITTLVTYFSVRIAERPPDAEHPYGHGKVESLSALGETALLGITCLGIAYQAVLRLVRGQETVRQAELAIGLMFISIVVDLVRTTVLRRTARRYKSQALAADALNFTGDILSSTVVIAGLLFVRIGVPWGDPLAGLIVAGVVLVGAVRLAGQAIDVLLDREPEELAQTVRAVVDGIEGVVSVRGLRARQVGPTSFVEVTVGVDRRTGVEVGHDIASDVEAALRSHIAPVDVVVHVEPVARPDESLFEQVDLLARRRGLPVHHVYIAEGAQGLIVDLHCEVERDLSLQEAHDLASALEEDVRRAIPGVVRVVTHIEPRHETPIDSHAPPSLRRRAEEDVREAARAVEGVLSCRDIEIGGSEEQYVLILHCVVDGKLSVEEAHHIASELELDVSRRLPDIRRVIVHTEPA